jgi:cytochrome oxidase Cu insertion factor (SCO1/SenC/PrrC family)
LPVGARIALWWPRRHLAASSSPDRIVMRHSARTIAVLTALLCLAGSSASAQQPAAAPPAYPAPEVGTMAPDFALSGATRYGLLKEPVRVSDLRGKTVVLAFFYRARTKG